MKKCILDAAHDTTMLMKKRGDYIYQCNQCGCIMADIEFSHQQYESENYYTMAFKRKEEIEAEWGFRWRYVLQRIMKASGGGSLLDVGAGNGYFTSIARSDFELAAVGLEISDEEIDFAKKYFDVDLIKEDIAEHRANYAVVTSFNVLEHVANPVEFLASMTARIEPGGLLALTTPNTACIHARVKGLKSWNMIDPPHHINLFSREALASLLQREGLEIVDYETLSTYINFARNIDTSSLLIRRTVFQILKMFDLGADHFFLARAPG